MGAARGQLRRHQMSNSASAPWPFHAFARRRHARLGHAAAAATTRGIAFQIRRHDFGVVIFSRAIPTAARDYFMRAMPAHIRVRQPHAASQTESARRFSAVGSVDDEVGDTRVATAVIAILRRNTDITTRPRRIAISPPHFAQTFSQHDTPPLSSRGDMRMPRDDMR